MNRIAPLSQHPYTRAISRLFGILVVLVGVVSCLPRSTPAVVKFGLIAPFEGPSRPLGYSVLFAVKLRLQEWNAGGGVPRVELVALNDDSNPTLAAVLPAQLAIDPDVLLVLGPPQGHTARAAWPELTAVQLPTLSLVPQPGSLSPTLIPFAGSEQAVQTALQGVGIQASLATTLPVTRPVVWMGDPYTLVQLLQDQPEDVAAAGSVALEDAFVAWAGTAAEDLTWIMATPTTWPPPWATAYEQLAGASPTPMAALAYAATDQALRQLPFASDRSSMADVLRQLSGPPLQVFHRTPQTCCLRLEVGAK